MSIIGLGTVQDVRRRDGGATVFSDAAISQLLTWFGVDSAAVDAVILYGAICAEGGTSAAHAQLAALLAQVQPQDLELVQTTMQHVQAACVAWSALYACDWRVISVGLGKDGQPGGRTISDRLSPSALKETRES